MAEDKKKMYYYGGKEKKAGEIKKTDHDEMRPYSEMDFQKEFDNMMQRFQREFEDFWGEPFWGRSLHWKHRYPMMPFKEPSVDLEDRGKDFRLTVDMPGFEKEDIDVQVEEDSIIIKAKKTQSEEEKQKTYVRHERAMQKYYRRIQLPEAIKSDDAKASLSNGILEVTVPKKEPKETKKLKVM